MSRRENNDARNDYLNEREAKLERRRQRREEHKNRRNARVARGRFIKNLFIWLLGVIFIPVVLVVASFVIPLKTITGEDGTYLSPELSNQSLFEVIKNVSTNIGEYGFSDFPIVGKALTDLQNTEIMVLPKL